MAQNISAILDKIIARYQPGGGFGEAATKVYEQQKGKSLASSRQNLVSAGLGGTSVGAGLETAYEQEVGQPFRLGIEEARTGALTQAMMAKAGFAEREQARTQEERLRREQMATQERASMRANRPTPTPGLDAFGQPMAGSAAATEQDYMKWQMGGGGDGDGGGRAQRSYTGLGERGYIDGGSQENGQGGGSTYRIAEGYGPMFGGANDLSGAGYTPQGDLIGGTEMPIGGPLSEAYQQKRQDKIMGSIQPLNIMKSGGKISSAVGSGRGGKKLAPWQQKVEAIKAWGRSRGLSYDQAVKQSWSLRKAGKF